MTDKILKVGTFFSGIGSPEKALERLKNNGYINNYSLEFFSEINKNAVKVINRITDKMIIALFTILVKI